MNGLQVFVGFGIITLGLWIALGHSSLDFIKGPLDPASSFVEANLQHRIEAVKRRFVLPMADPTLAHEAVIAAKEFQLDPFAVATTAWVESGFVRNTPGGGPWQVTTGAKSAFQEVVNRYPDHFSQADAARISDPLISARAGAAYMRYLLDIHKGDPSEIMGYYNGGGVSNEAYRQKWALFYQYLTGGL